MTAVTLTPFAATDHAAAARTICDTLTLSTPEAFASLCIVLRAKLNPTERQWLAWAVLRACDDHEAEDVALDVLGLLPVGGPA